MEHSPRSCSQVSRRRSQSHKGTTSNRSCSSAFHQPSKPIQCMGHTSAGLDVTSGLHGLHTYIHTYILACLHSHTHTHTRAHAIWTRTHTYTLTCIIYLSIVDIEIYTYMHTCIYSYTHRFHWSGFCHPKTCVFITSYAKGTDAHT